MHPHRKHIPTTTFGHGIAQRTRLTVHLICRYPRIGTSSRHAWRNIQPPVHPWWQNHVGRRSNLSVRHTILQAIYPRYEPHRRIGQKHTQLFSTLPAVPLYDSYDRRFYPLLARGPHRCLPHRDSSITNRCNASRTASASSNRCVASGLLAHRNCQPFFRSTGDTNPCSTSRTSLRPNSEENDCESSPSVQFASSIAPLGLLSLTRNTLRSMCLPLDTSPPITQNQAQPPTQSLPTNQLWCVAKPTEN